MSHKNMLWPSFLNSALFCLRVVFLVAVRQKFQHLRSTMGYHSIDRFCECWTFAIVLVSSCCQFVWSLASLVWSLVCKIDISRTIKKFSNEFRLMKSRIEPSRIQENIYLFLKIYNLGMFAPIQVLLLRNLLPTRWITFVVSQKTTNFQRTQSMLSK
jgi:hypothetical protein